MEGKPEVIQKRERTRRETLRLKKQKELEEGRAQENVEVKEVHLRLILQMTLWDSCEVPIDVVILKEYLTDGTYSEWLLGNHGEGRIPLGAVGALPDQADDRGTTPPVEVLLGSDELPITQLRAGG